MDAVIFNFLSFLFAEFRFPTPLYKTGKKILADGREGVCRSAKTNNENEKKRKGDEMGSSRLLVLLRNERTTPVGCPTQGDP